MSVRTIEQSVAATFDFTGAAPSGALSRASDLEIWSREPGDGGGLFDFELTRPTLVHQILLGLGGQTAFTIAVLDRDDVAITLHTGTTAAFFHSSLNSADELSNLILFEGEKLRITTTGATGILIAKISVDQYRS